MRHDPREDRYHKNLNRTIDEIDERQVQELLTLLDQWEADEIGTGKVLTTIEDLILGGNFRSDVGNAAYHIDEDCPGDEYYKFLLEYAVEDTERQLKNFEKRAEHRNLRAVKGKLSQYLEHDPKYDGREYALRVAQRTLAKLQEDTGYAPIASNTDVMGSKGYVDAVQALIEFRGEPRDEGQEYAEICANIQIIKMVRLYQKSKQSTSLLNF